MLCICWDWENIIHYELLPSDKIINSDFYCQQLIRFKLEVEKKRVVIDQHKGDAARMFGRDRNVNSDGASWESYGSTKYTSLSPT
ncbi:hypothetical protein EVAR_47246_1 [Eumeta japonica]|uniref:Mariner Mos1 transposase n=1 Tax=Eumeta variegata TaxID=151549 RepID=A0A4C1XEL2_EUMVA|nr:hypothetical protein EVAR_47246_1 [Eumeta japonica]